MTQLYDDAPETLVLDRSALGHNLRPLERNGLIELVAGDDRRRRRVVLTTTGRAKFMQGRRAWKLARDRFIDEDSGRESVEGDIRFRMPLPANGGATRHLVRSRTSRPIEAASGPG